MDSLQHVGADFTHRRICLRCLSLSRERGLFTASAVKKLAAIPRRLSFITFISQLLVKRSTQATRSCR